MGRAKSIIPKREMDKLKKRFDAAIQSLAEDVAMDIEQAYENSIDAFYREYTPRWYKRTYSTYLASSGYTDLFGENFHVGDTYNAGIVVEGSNIKRELYRADNAGIVVEGSNIKGEPYRADTEWVFNRTYYKGYHGFTVVDRNKYGKKYSWNEMREKKNLYKKIKKNKYTTKMTRNGEVFLVRNRYSPSSTFVYNSLTAYTEAVRAYAPFIAPTGHYILKGVPPEKNMKKQMRVIKKKKNLDNRTRKKLEQFFG